jgi:predicted aconitase with swiveling domain
VADVIRGRPVVSGYARGKALVSNEPLSFWGGYDHQTGEITDRRHPLSGAIGSGRVLALPFSRGSSTTTAVLLEAVRAGTAPAAILTTGRDPYLALASVAAGLLYSQSIPIIALTTQEFTALRTGRQVEIRDDGTIYITA